MANNIGSIFFITVLIVSILTIFSFFGQEVQDKNTNLDNTSQRLLTTLTGVQNSYSSSNFTVSSNNLTTNSSFADTDPFVRSYLEDKSEIQQKKGVLEQIFSMPKVLIEVTGLNQPVIVIIILGFIGSVLAFYLGLAIYKAIRTGEVD